MFKRLLSILSSRTTIVNTVFVAGILALSFGAELMGSSMGINGLGWATGGIATICFAYLLGAE